MSYCIFTDSNANLPRKIMEELDIQVLPCHYLLDGERVEYSGVIDDFDSKTYYDALRAGRRVTTSLFNQQSFVDHFRPFLEQGQDIIYVGLSSAVSGSYHASTLAAAELMAEFPGRKVRTVDSRGACLGVGILTCMAADLRKEGLSIDAAVSRLNEATDHLCQYFTVENLMYLRRSGRISAASAAVGTLLNIKPLLWGDEQGRIVCVRKCRGRKSAVDAIVEKYRTKAVNPEACRVGISHGDCPEEAQELAERICAIAKPKELLIYPHEPFSGSHSGPGMLALYFFGDSR